MPLNDLKADVGDRRVWGSSVWCQGQEEFDIEVAEARRKAEER